jgi:hypothetical protein
MHEKTEAATRGAIQRAIDSRAWNLTNCPARLVVDRGDVGVEVLFGTVLLVTQHAGIELAGDGTGSALIQIEHLARIDPTTDARLDEEKAKAQRPAAR